MSKSADLIKKRQNVVNEIIKTEHTYLMGLQLVNTLITGKLKKLKEQEEIIFYHPKILEMFESLTGIEDKSKVFVEKLHITIVASQTKNPADAFDGLSDLVAEYINYIKLYHVCQPLLKVERSKIAAFNKVCEYFEMNTHDTVDAFLITPVQRPPRYRLLLQELIKYTPKELDEYKQLNQRLEEIMRAIANVDQNLEYFDEFNQMTELQSKVYDFDIIGVRGRRLYFHGPATKFSRSYTNKRYLALFNDGLLILETILVTSWKLNKFYKSGEYLIKPADDNPPFENAIDVRQKDKSFRCNLESPKAKSEFLKGFDKMLETNGLQRAKLEISGFAPVWIPDDQAPVCMECKKKFTLFIRRHHCRWCGKCICGDCFKNSIRLPGLSVEPKHVCNECYKLLNSREMELIEASLAKGTGIANMLKDSGVVGGTPFVSALDRVSDSDSESK